MWRLHHPGFMRVGGEDVTTLRDNPDDKGKLADLKAAIQEADASSDFIDADQAFEIIKADLRKKYSHTDE